MRNKNLIILIACLLIAASGFLLFHHHPEGDHTQHCLICRLVQYVAFIFVSAVVLATSSVSRIFFLVPVKKLSSFLLADHLQGRAPPVSA